jgi:hypothetical protein
MEKKDKKKKLETNSQSRDHEITIEKRLPRLLEISRQMETLRSEQERLIQSLLPDGDLELYFDDHKRRISWASGSVKLGKKFYLFVKTIWLGKNHQVEFSELEESEWNKQREAKGKMFISQQTVSMLVQHTQQNLAESDFPYAIEPLKNNSSDELEGFRLVAQTTRKES